MYIFQPDRFLLRKQIKAMAHYVSGKVLDVGAGERARYNDLFTFDKYIKMDVTEGPNVDVVGSADKMPFGDGEFDSVVCTQVFEHLVQPNLAAKEVARVLKSGGHLLITVPQMNELHEEPHDYFRYTKYGLISLFENAGLDMVSMEARGGFWTLLAQIKIRYITDLFNLYQHPLLGAIAGKIFRIGGEFAFWLDRLDKSKANHTHTIGWCAVVKKI
jgi:SAM-dependent methyltransferase